MEIVHFILYQYPENVSYRIFHFCYENKTFVSFIDLKVNDNSWQLWTPVVAPFTRGEYKFMVEPVLCGLLFMILTICAASSASVPDIFAVLFTVPPV